MIDTNSDTSKLDYENEKREGLRFPNWTDCKYKNTTCLPCICEAREAHILMGRCSNNNSIEDCWMYQYLKRM